MINRELIRIKVLQLVYAYYQNSDKNLGKAEDDLKNSLSKAHELYYYLLYLIVTISKEMRHRYDIAFARAKREDKITPSPKFIDNRFALQLEENDTLREFVSHQKVMWENDFEFIMGLCNSIEQSAIYQEYMASEDDSYENDREIWRKIYRTLIQDNDALDAILEEKSLYWNDDKAIIDTFVIKTLKQFNPENGSEQELLPKYKDSKDEDFAITLFRATLLNANKYQQYMDDVSKNWELERMPFMDVIIMQIAIAEMITFDSIPISVTINEYVNLAKIYSTRKSGSYINGLLDTIARQLVEQRIILKPMPDSKEQTNDTQEDFTNK